MRCGTVLYRVHHLSRLVLEIPQQDLEFFLHVSDLRLLLFPSLGSKARPFALQLLFASFQPQTFGRSFAQVSMQAVEKLADIPRLRAQLRPRLLDDHGIQPQPLRNVDPRRRSRHADPQLVSRLQRGFIESDRRVHHSRRIGAENFQRSVMRRNDCDASNPPEVLGDLTSIERGQEMAIVSHYNIRRVVDIYGAVQDRDLGAVAKNVEAIVHQHEKTLPRGMFISLRGQVQTMRSSYVSLLGGLVFAIVLVYMLIVVNFQSWLDPFIIITALPAALAGIVIFLFLTHTSLSVPALMGAIMCMGVATANSILVVSFAKIRLAEHGDPILAAIEAGATRFRPVCMTALAMIIGMVPMALGLGDGGEQNAPLGRAVIGGLLCATVATLVFVPAVFGMLHGSKKEGATLAQQEGAQRPQHA